MAIVASQIPIPSSGAAVQVPITQLSEGELSVSVRNTGTVTVMLGGANGNLLYPLLTGEALGFSADTNAVLNAEVQTAGTAGQLTLLEF